MSCITKVIDTRTGEEGVFRTLTEAGEWIRTVLGKGAYPGTLCNCINDGRLYKKRFKLERIEEARKEPSGEKEHRTRRDGWSFFQFPYSKDVICAEKKLKYYDRRKFERVRQKLSNYGCVCYFDTTQDESEEMKRKKSRVEIYRLLKDTPFEDKVNAMLELAGMVAV